MITGFNTDIEYEGVVYHVQTEDKGLDSPLILSLVYSGGAILASKRSRYEDLIAEGFDEEVLTQRVKRQHRLICAAINAGRLEDLKRMGAKPGGVTGPLAPLPLAEGEVGATEFTQPPEEAAQPEPAPIEFVSNADDSPIAISIQPDETAPPEIVERPRTAESAYSVHDPRRRSVPDQVMGAESGLALTILDDDEFLAGNTYTIRVLLEDRSGAKQKPLGGIGISVRILGTIFRPQIYSVKTERDGVAVVSATMPSFSSGRAAVLVRSVVKGQLIEVRRVIHPAG